MKSYPPELLKSIVDESEYYLDPSYKEDFDDFEVVDHEVTYYDDDPSDIWVIRHIPTGEYYKVINYRDSWGGADWEPTVLFVTPKEVMVTQYHMIEGQEPSINFDGEDDDWDNDTVDDIL